MHSDAFSLSGSYQATSNIVITVYDPAGLLKKPEKTTLFIGSFSVILISNQIFTIQI